MQKGRLSLLTKKFSIDFHLLYLLPANHFGSAQITLKLSYYAYINRFG